MQKRKEKTALLVIDCQNYFLDPQSPAFLQNSPAIVPKINRLTKAFSEAGRPVFFTVHRAPTQSGNLMSGRYQRLPRGRDCLLWPGIAKPAKSIVLSKEHYSAFQRTDLEPKLRRLGVKKIYLCGVMTHLCVDTTARHGFMLGFWPAIIADACCSKSPAYHRAALLALEHGFAEILTVKEAMGHAAKDL